ncbi:FKBP-type peptidyl-prolyl cis-trans isomerase [Flaviaesturariibacter aridisoli]|uniref:Peptidyl-prolyl cis-trans isomerase n=1 Tax=Flaviaesturariibacter aridisoli TaxID=2545761 RepID=A0A4R4E8A0_9BACT|nr:FKBP-type peptidyl-prolyl cis-trans isomerase [Flaviaesturariibacter aridisoli]TCZ73975.1 FKBP-type peptidyl-prolyl cis-trans isomerase [Flaviaesturariibacter aridisoli]
MSLFDRLQGAKQDKINEQKQAGATFLEENKKKEGITELPSGIQYQVLQEGSGNKPAANSEIKAHYAGRLLDGKEFDSSYRRNQPFTARLTQLIKGWQEVLPLMPEGSKWRLWIPSNLAYGDNGVPGIPGGATLEFDVELLQILR